MHHAQRANWGLAGTHIEVWSLTPPPLSSQATWKNMKGAVEADRGQRQTEMGECSMPCKSLHLRRCYVRKESASKHQRQGNDSQARKCKSGNSGKEGLLLRGHWLYLFHLLRLAVSSQWRLAEKASLWGQGSHIIPSEKEALTEGGKPYSSCNRLFYFIGLFIWFWFLISYFYLIFDYHW